MYKIIVLFIIIIGIIFITISLTKNQVQNNMKEQEPKIEYRYIPRTFEEEQFNPVYPSEVFETMFSEPSPWILSIREYDERKQEKINQYFVTQL